MDYIIFMTLPGSSWCSARRPRSIRYSQRDGPGRSAPPWRQQQGGNAGTSAITFEGLDARLSAGGTLHELKERQTVLMLRDDEEDGAPPNRTMVDLDEGTAVVRMPKETP